MAQKGAEMNDSSIEELIQREKQLEKDVTRLRENGMTAQAGSKQADSTRFARNYGDFGTKSKPHSLKIPRTISTVLTAGTGPTDSRTRDSTLPIALGLAVAIRREQRS